MSAIFKKMSNLMPIDARVHYMADQQQQATTLHPSNGKKDIDQLVSLFKFLIN